MAQAPREETFDGKDGLKIFLRSWRPDAKPRAVLVICHGFNSHGGQYAWAAEQFVRHGLAVLRSICEVAESRRANASTSKTSWTM